MTDIVFAGPTIGPAEVAALLPAAQILPPVKHGDLLRLDVTGGDRVLIIDGLFLQAASVRHREILCLIKRGVTVAGSSSMGALRAAELWPYGMRGFGEVFRLYRDGVIDGDDEVAVVHGTEEDAYRSYSDPLVSIRIALRDATADGAIGAQDAQLMLDLVMAMPFRARSFRALDRAAGTRLPARTVTAFAAWRSAHDTNAKAADARLMLTAAAAGDPALEPAGAGDRPIRNLHTQLLDSWEPKFHGRDAGGGWVADAEAAHAIRLAHPGFRDAHRRHVLARLTGIAPDHPALTGYAAAEARRHGLSVPGQDSPDSWITRPDLAQPADEVLATLLVRSIGTRNTGSMWNMPPGMRTDAVMAWGRELVVAARRCNERLLTPAGGGPRRRFKPEVVDRAVTALWGCELSCLQAQAWDRGIADLATLRRIAEPFVAHVKVLGVPGPITAAG